MALENETKELLEMVKTELLEEVPEMRAAVTDWGEILIKIQVKKRMADSPEEVESLKTLEGDSWSALLQKKAQFASKLESKSWTFAEAALRILKKVVLSF